MPLPGESLPPEALGALLVDRDVAHLEQALLTALDHCDRSALQGELARRRGDFANATTLLDLALGSRPEIRALHHAAALAHAAGGDRSAARARWMALLDRAPDDAIARFQVAVTHHDDGDLPQAARWYEAQTAHAPRMAGGWLNLGIVRKSLGDAPGAMVAWDRAHAARPDDPRPLILSAALAGERAELPDAIARLTRAIEVAPDNASARFARASHRSSLALHAEAVDDLARAVALDPTNATGRSALLVELHYEESLRSPAQMRALHDGWAMHHAQPAVVVAHRKRESRVRIGYLSPRFGDVPLAALLLPVLDAHDRSRFEIHAYAAHPAHGDDADRVRRSVDRWLDLPADDDQAAALIAADPPDLLIDLAGHSPGNRLPMLSRKPAPRIATWLDYFDTTGVAAIDFLIGDRFHTPFAHAPRFHERLVILPHARFSYRPPLSIPRDPRRTRGSVSFGSFNRHAKITDAVIDTWAEILRAVPGATLSLRASAYRSPQTITFVRDRWQARGIPVERIAFEPYVSLQALHAAYEGVDIALDPFPFNGGVTTCDALANGVPVVTLEGERMISRQGCALLHAANRSRWIAKTRDDYVRVAVALTDADVLEAERHALQAEFPRSPLCDTESFTRSFEAACLRMIDTADASNEPVIIDAADAAR